MTLDIEIKIFFSLCNIIYYSQHIIILKACLNTERHAIALHQERFLTPKYSPLLIPCLQEKVDRAAFSLPSFSLSSQLFHINLQTNVLSLFSPLLSSICFRSMLYLVPELHEEPQDGGGNTSCCGAASDKVLGLLSSWVQSPCTTCAPKGNQLREQKCSTCVKMVSHWSQ